MMSMCIDGFTKWAIFLKKKEIIWFKGGYTKCSSLAHSPTARGPKGGSARTDLAQNFFSFSGELLHSVFPTIKRLARDRGWSLEREGQHSKTVMVPNTKNNASRCGVENEDYQSISSWKSPCISAGRDPP